MELCLCSRVIMLYFIICSSENGTVCLPERPQRDTARIHCIAQLPMSTRQGWSQGEHLVPPQALVLKCCWKTLNGWVTWQGAGNSPFLWFRQIFFLSPACCEMIPVGNSTVLHQQVKIQEQSYILQYHSLLSSLLFIWILMDGIFTALFAIVGAGHWGRTV